MNEEDSEWGKARKHPRISWSFVAKVRLIEADEKWQMTNVKNISEGGCYFYSGQVYEIGKTVEMEIKIPRIEEPMYFIGEVKRCEEKNRGTTQLYGIGVQFQRMDEEKKDKFIETVVFFLRKQRESEE